MKKILFISIFLSIAIFTACSGGGDDENSYDFPEDSLSYTLPQDCEEIEFSSSYAGKKCYVIYTNETSIDQMNTSDSVYESMLNEAEEISTNETPAMKIYKKAVNMGNGFYRDEVQFDYSNLKIHRNSRTANDGSDGYNYHTPDSSNHSNFFITINSTNENDITSAPFTLKKEGSHCRIWVKSSITTNITDYNSLASVIDSSYEKLTSICGSNAYNGGYNEISATSSTKLDILIYDLFNDSTEGGVLGYFNGNDFYRTTYYSLSNACQNIHIDSYWLKNATNITKSTLIHEFQHLLNFCRKTYSYQTWFTEMLSMSVEDIFQNDINLEDVYSPKGRFYVDFDKPYLGFLNWPQDSKDPDLGYIYANAYAFGAYLMRNYGGVRLIHEIATNQYVNSTAITEALHTIGYTNESFESVLRKFGMVYINTQIPVNSLYKTINEQFAGNNYVLTSIDLTDYYFRLYYSQNDLTNDCKKNLYYAENQAGSFVVDGTTIYAIFGPRIYKSSYKMTEAIKPYGFTVYYVGTIGPYGSSFDVKHDSNLTMTVVVK